MEKKTAAADIGYFSLHCIHFLSIHDYSLKATIKYNLAKRCLLYEVHD